MSVCQAAQRTQGPAPLTHALQALLSLMQVPPSALGPLCFDGDDPQFDSPWRLAGAMGVAAMAAAAAAAAVGHSRGLPTQALHVSLATAARHIFPEHNHAPRLNGAPYPRAGLSEALLQGLYRTRDGRFFVPSALSAGERGRWARALQAAPTAPSLRQAVARRSGAQLEQLAARWQLAGACARRASSWLRHPHGAVCSARPVVDFEVAQALATAGPALPVAATRPLAGLKVLVLGRVFAGPLAGRTLAEQGAQVLQLSNVRAPEPMSVYLESCVGSRSAAVDLRSVADRRAVRQLAEQADVVIDNARAGVMAAACVDSTSLQRHNPRLVHVRIDAFGAVGPWAHRAGYDMTVAAATGLMWPNGQQWPQFLPSLLLVDFVTAQLAAAAVCAALLAHGRARPFRHLSLNLARVASWCMQLGRCGGTGSQRSCVVVPQQRFETPYGHLLRLPPLVSWQLHQARWQEPVLCQQGSAALCWPSQNIFWST